jgi:Uma2 family endonuclease
MHPQPSPALSEDDFYRLAGEDSDREYLDGGLWIREPASNRHEDLFRFLLTVLGGFLDERGGGIVRGSRYPMRLDERWSPEPDLLVVREEHLARLPDQRLERPADLVIEIASASDPRLDLRKKLPRYREARIPEIWWVDPFAEVVEVNRLGPNGYAAARTSEGRLPSTVVPGFWIEVDWLWSGPLPSTLACLRGILA